jgi:succinate dehydrogenase / fumarate reductase cytochrome b subunit
MGQVFSFYRSLLGQKLIMGVTGIILFAFIVGHLLGNLQIFSGPAPLNRYAAFLKSTGELLWTVRLILLIALILHIVAAIRITLAKWSARPIGYLEKDDIVTNYAARTMMITGPLVFLYVIYHLMMFTFLTTGPGYSPTDVYANEIAAFRVPLISIVYIIAMLVLGTHLYHGVWSMLHTIGISNPRYGRLRWIVAPAVAIAITLGYIIIPLAVWVGLLT